ncbi:MAG TPA: FHA domain-containing protein [Gammaproteobacteria bacterium]|nr:FHA domain-containing protein [Gammaproteobacteria bacterium]
MEDKTYVIGRHGHIQLFDKTTSARHAELVVTNNQLYLTDLNSTNGTYLIEPGKRKRFTEGYISLDQTLSFGRHVCTVRELVARAAMATVSFQAEPG